MKNKGFSLVELLVAVAILGLVSLPIASYFVIATKTESRAEVSVSAQNAMDDVFLLISEMDPTAFSEELKKPKFGEGDTLFKNVKSEDNVYQFTYKEYEIRIILTTPESEIYPISRADIKLTYQYDGELHILTRKAVLHNG